MMHHDNTRLSLAFTRFDGSKLRQPLVNVKSSEQIGLSVLGKVCRGLPSDSDSEFGGGVAEMWRGRDRESERERERGGRLEVMSGSDWIYHVRAKMNTMTNKTHIQALYTLAKAFALKPLYFPPQY